MERLMKKRLAPYISDERFASRWQYGFVQGRSAENALCRLRPLIRTNHSSHVVEFSLMPRQHSTTFGGLPSSLNSLFGGVPLTWPDFWLLTLTIGLSPFRVTTLPNLRLSPKDVPRDRFLGPAFGTWYLIPFSESCPILRLPTLHTQMIFS